MSGGGGWGPGGQPHTRHKPPPGIPGASGGGAGLIGGIGEVYGRQDADWCFFPSNWSALYICAGDKKEGKKVAPVKKSIVNDYAGHRTTDAVCARMKGPIEDAYKKRAFAGKPTIANKAKGGGFDWSVGEIVGGGTPEPKGKPPQLKSSAGNRAGWAFSAVLFASCPRLLGTALFWFKRRAKKRGARGEFRPDGGEITELEARIKFGRITGRG
jgi:hypothetical protein